MDGANSYTEPLLVVDGTKIVDESGTVNPTEIQGGEGKKDSGLLDYGNEDKNTEDAARTAASGHMLAMVVTMPIFMGYASLNAMQRKVKVQLGIGDNSSSESNHFSFAVSMLYLGNLIWRVAHNIVFVALTPRQRVYVAYTAMAGAMCTIGFGIFIGKVKGLGLVYLAYSLGGLAVGSFESNVLSAITPLGHATKKFAVLGIPIGYNLVNVGAFAVFWAVPDDKYVQFGVYMFVVLGLIVGAMVFCFCIPETPMKGTQFSLRHFWDTLLEFPQWGKLVSFNSVALMLDMFCVSLFSAVAQYIYDSDHVQLVPKHSARMTHNSFLLVYNLCTFLGDTLSRRIIYRTKPRHPLLFVLLSITGAVLCLSKVAILAFPGIFLVFFANGSIYATTTKRVDSYVLDRHHLVAMSFWLFVGDVGSFTGSNVVPYVKNWVGCAHGFVEVAGKCVAKVN